ncbi:MAG: LysR family transcriptional regulator, partial [Moraxellaceae bacterium]
GKAMALTGTGMDLLEHARTMDGAAKALGLAASGRAEAPGGVVSVSASDAVATCLLPPILRRLRAQEPGIVVEVIASNALSDLLRREADIAIRHVPPTQPELIGRKLRDARASFYAASDWVARHGHPRTALEAQRCEFVGADRDGTYLSYLQQHGLAVTEANFSCYAEHSVAHWALVQQGLGIGAMMDEIARDTPGIVRVLDEVPPVLFPVWLVSHRELRTARRIRVVFEALAAALA